MCRGSLLWGPHSIPFVKASGLAEVCVLAATHVLCKACWCKKSTLPLRVQAPIQSGLWSSAQGALATLLGLAILEPVYFKMVVNTPCLVLSHSGYHASTKSASRSHGSGPFSNEHHQNGCSSFTKLLCTDIYIDVYIYIYICVYKRTYMHA